MKFGKTIKIIRNDKGMTQKEVGQNILSQSAYSKFESGLTEVCSTFFVDILERLDISYEEFKFVSNNYEYPKYEKITNKFFSLPYNDVKSLEKIIQEVDAALVSKESHLLHNIRSISKALVSLQADQDLRVAQKHIFPIWDRLSKIESWYLNDIRTLNAILYFFPSETAIEITNTILKRLDKYDGFQDSNKLKINLKVNITLLFIKEKNYRSAYKVIKETLQFHRQEMVYPTLAIALGRLAICSNLLNIGQEDVVNQIQSLLSVYNDPELYEQVMQEYYFYTD